MTPSSMAAGAPGEGTTVRRSVPPELRADLPAHDPEAARRQTRELLSRTAEAVASAEAAVQRLQPGYPSSFSATVTWLKGKNLQALSAAGRDPFAALAEVRRIWGEVESTASALVANARGISSRMGRIDSGRIS